MKEYYKNIHITQEGLNSIYKPGDLVKINKSKLGIVLFKPNTKQKSLFMLSKIGFDTSKAFKSKKNFSLLIKAYKSHFNNNSFEDIIDIETFKIMINHYNQLLTK